MKLKTRVASLLLALMASYAPTQAQFVDRIHGLPNEEEVLMDIKHTVNGETVQVGTIYRNNDAEQSDALIMYADATGNTTWRKRLTTQFGDALYRVTVASNRDLIAVGYTTQAMGAGTQRKGLVCRYQPNGTLLWTREWMPPAGTYQGDRGPIYKGVCELANRNIVAVGSVNADRPGGAAIITMFDQWGNQIWNRIYQHDGSNAFYDVIEFNGEIVACGYADDGGTSRDGVLVRFNAAGNMVGSHGYSMNHTYNPTATQSIPLDCVHLMDLHVFNNSLFVAGNVTSDWVFLPSGDNSLMLSINATWNATALTASNPPNFWSVPGFFIPTGVNQFLVGQNPGAAYYGDWAIVNQPNDYIITRINAGMVVESTHPVAVGDKALVAASLDANGNIYASGVMRGGTVQIGEDDALNVFNTMPFANTTECDPDEPDVLVERPDVITNKPLWTVDTNWVRIDSAVIERVLVYQTMSPCDSIPPPDDTTGAGCSEECYWRLVGNNVTPPENKFGTLNNQAVRFFTDNNQRGVLTADGEWGIRVNTVTTNIHMDAGTPPSSVPSGLRIENLPDGDGRALVVDANGYVYLAQSHLYKQGAGSNSEMQSQIDELKKQVEELKNMLGQGTGQQIGATLSVSPNPTNGEFAANYSITQPYGTGEIKITDVSGKVLMTKPLENNNTNGTIRVSLPKTISSEHIICTLICDGKVIASQKMVLINK
jgi:hypothetical protein